MPQVQHFTRNIHTFFPALTSVGTDMLSLLYDEPIDGMSQESAWVYQGGAGWAGMHVEDGYLDSVNAMPWTEFDVSLMSPVERAVVRMAAKFCRKVRAEG